METKPRRLSIDRLSYAYGGRPGHGVVLDDFSLKVEPGEFMTLLGPSGSGKSTVLRLIAGYLTVESGRIALGDHDITAAPPQRRDIGMVFQHFALFPHMTVEQNVNFGLRMRHLRKNEATRRVGEMLEVVQLSGYERRYPAELSGGQQQRVALARALAIRPQLLLFDEPLSSLDAKLRVTMQDEIRRIQKDSNVTAIYVTHDQGEALSMSDRVAVMNQGKVEQCATPKEIYDHPNTLFVGRFVGELNTLPATVLDGDGFEITVCIGETCSFTLPRTALSNSSPARDVVVAVRPENLSLATETTPAAASLPGVVGSVRFAGRHQRVQVEVSGGIRVWVSDTERTADIGDRVTVQLRTDRCSVFPSSAK